MLFHQKNPIYDSLELFFGHWPIDHLRLIGKLFRKLKRKVAEVNKVATKKEFEKHSIINLLARMEHYFMKNTIFASVFVSLI